MVTVVPAAYSTPPIVNLLTLKGLPSASVSLVNTVPVAGVPSATVFESGIATGAVFDETTVITNVCVGQFVV